MSQLILEQLGKQDYQRCVEKMRSFTDSRDKNTPDQLWSVEHDPVFTLGQAGKEEHLLNPNNIPVVKTDRGGQITYHGPGQIIIYCLIDIKRLGIGARALVTAIETSLIQTLAEIGIEAFSKKEAPGVYVARTHLPEPLQQKTVSDDAKIAALGLRIRKACSYHGLSLNFDMDLSPFTDINPCGYPDQAVCQIKDFNQSITRAEVESLLCNFLAQNLKLKLNLN